MTDSSLETLKECLQSLSTKTQPKTWQNALDTIGREADHFQQILKAGKFPIYGATTRVGHRDHEQLAPEEIQEFQKDFLTSHVIGSSPWYPSAVSRCIGYAKMYSFAAGGSGISRELYLATARTVLTDMFKPKIPQSCTYSCGDVIPGAHWTQALLDCFPDYTLRAGEVMALLNGSFIHVGYTISLIEPLEKLGRLLIETTRLNNKIVKANRVNFSAPCKQHSRRIVQYIFDGLEFSCDGYSHQDPISIRSTPQIIETFVEANRLLYGQLNHHLKTPSNNPLFSLDLKHPISQASFLAPSLSIKTEGVIESILFALWASVNRTQYLLSGQVSTIPRDGANDESALQFIQYPKLMMSILEQCRQTCGRRIFAAGAQTSNGIEDLWTYGVNTAAQLDYLCKEGARLLATELYVLDQCNRLFNQQSQLPGGDWSVTKEANDCHSFIDTTLSSAWHSDSEALLSRTLMNL